MLSIAENEQGSVEKDLLALPILDAMFDPIFIAIALIPLEPEDLFKGILHAPNCISQKYTRQFGLTTSSSLIKAVIELNTAQRHHREATRPLGFFFRGSGHFCANSRHARHTLTILGAGQKRQGKPSAGMTVRFGICNDL